LFYCLKGYIFLFSRSYLNFILNTKKINYLESFNLCIVSLLLIELENVIRLYAWELVRKKVIKNKKTHETFVFFFIIKMHGKGNCRHATMICWPGDCINWSRGSDLWGVRVWMNKNSRDKEGFAGTVYFFLRKRMFSFLKKKDLMLEKYLIKYYHLKK